MSDPPATFRVCEKLRANLAGVMGSAGFRALLSRSLTLSDSEVPWLRSLRTNVDGSLEGLDEVKTQVRAEQIAQGGVVLIAHLLGILVVLIGEDLTLRFVREAWPKLSLEDLPATKGDHYEKAK